jgi:hypothetical protein
VEWLGNGLVLLIGGLVIWGLWRASRPPRMFVIRIARGQPRVVAGKVTPAFLRRVREVVAEHGIPAGRVYGLSGRDRRIRLKFTRRFPPSACQQLRNWWEQSGWTAGPRRT